MSASGQSQWNVNILHCCAPVTLTGPPDECRENQLVCNNSDTIMCRARPAYILSAAYHRVCSQDRHLEKIPWDHQMDLHLLKALQFEPNSFEIPHRCLCYFEGQTTYHRYWTTTRNYLLKQRDRYSRFVLQVPDTELRSQVLVYKSFKSS